VNDLATRHSPLIDNSRACGYHPCMPAPFRRFSTRQVNETLTPDPRPPTPSSLDLQPFALGPVDASVACLLIHGFSGSPPEMRWLGAYLAERGVRVEGVRLAGHGTQPEELNHLTWQDWLHSASEGMDRLKHAGRKTVVVGFSMGGLLGI